MSGLNEFSNGTCPVLIAVYVLVAAHDVLEHSILLSDEFERDCLIKLQGFFDCWQINRVEGGKNFAHDCFHLVHLVLMPK